jgi:lysophospholipase L1-like esterase
MVGSDPAGQIRGLAPVNEAPRRAVARKLRTSMAAAGLVLFDVVVACVAMEILARTFFADGGNFDIEMWRYAEELKRDSDIPGVGHEHIPNSSGHFENVDIKINAHKLREYDYDFAKPAGVTRILMLGDSVTMGWGAPFDDSTPKKLEKRLNADAGGRRYQVINTGVGNYNPAMEIAYFLAEGYRYDPDIVVLNFTVNDAEPTPVRKHSLIFENSYAAVLAAGAWDTLLRLYGSRPDWKQYYEEIFADDAPGWLFNQRSIAQLAAYCRSHNIRLLIANYPDLHQLVNYPLQLVTDKIAAVSKANSTAFVDLLPAVADVAQPRTLWTTASDAHPNGLAATRYATLLQQTLRSNFPDQF